MTELTELHNAVGLQLGANIWEPHHCTRGTTVDVSQTRRLSCKGVIGWSARHRGFNHPIWRALSENHSENCLPTQVNEGLTLILRQNDTRDLRHRRHRQILGTHWTRTTYAELSSSAIFCFTVENSSSSLAVSFFSSTAPVNCCSTRTMFSKFRQWHACLNRFIGLEPIAQVTRLTVSLILHVHTKLEVSWGKSMPIFWIV